MAQQPSFHGNLAIFSTMCAIKPESHEEVVQMLWQMIITEWFPGRQGYKYGIKAQVLANDNAPDVVVFQILALNPNPQVSEDVLERQILLIECKRPSFDTPSGWQNTITGQFFDDLMESGNSTNRLYGAVAIGKKVRFFRFDGRAAVTSQKLLPLHQGTIDMGIPNGQAEAERVLDHIKATAWAWSGS